MRSERSSALSGLGSKRRSAFSLDADPGVERLLSTTSAICYEATGDDLADQDDVEGEAGAGVEQALGRSTLTSSVSSS